MQEWHWVGQQQARWLASPAGPWKESGPHPRDEAELGPRGCTTPGGTVHQEHNGLRQVEEGEVAKGASREGDGAAVIGTWQPRAARQDAGQR